jgi:hypothetical protein
MLCPKCQFDHPEQTTECLRCGIIFARYQAALEMKAAGLGMPRPMHAPVTPAPAVPTVVVPPMEAPWERYDARSELKYRALALPLALLVARWVAGTGLGILSGLLAMLVHESGHAVTAWLTGRWAVPMLWVTQWGQFRSWWIVLSITGGLIFAAYQAWKAQRWGWVCAALAVLALQLVIQSLPVFTQGSLIVFGGDGGALVLATILMAMFYAPRGSVLYKSWGLRWGLLVIGALAFMHVYRLWSGPYENIPFGEIEGVNLSDPTLLTDEYGWTVIQLVDRYLLLARVCFAALFVVYLWGLISAYLETRSEAPQR